jgi:hypothetical protein
MCIWCLLAVRAEQDEELQGYYTDLLVTCHLIAEEEAVRRNRAIAEYDQRSVGINGNSFAVVNWGEIAANMALPLNVPQYLWTPTPEPRVIKEDENATGTDSDCRGV